MNERRIRFWVAAVLIGGQLLTLVLVIGLTAADRFTSEELFASFGVIGPLFAAYTTVAVRRLLAQAPLERLRDISPERAFVALLFPTMFVGLVVFVILWKAFGRLTFDDFLKLIGALQTLLGVYIGYVVESVLLGRRLQPQDPSQPGLPEPAKK